MVALDDLLAQMINPEGTPGTCHDTLLAADALLFEEIDQACVGILDQCGGGADLSAVRRLALAAHRRDKHQVFAEFDHVDAGIQWIEDPRLLERTGVHARPASGTLRRLKHKYLHAHTPLVQFPFQLWEV